MYCFLSKNNFPLFVSGWEGGVVENGWVCIYIYMCGVECYYMDMTRYFTWLLKIFMFIYLQNWVWNKRIFDGVYICGNRVFFFFFGTTYRTKQNFCCAYMRDDVFCVKFSQNSVIRL